jgi:hypothetical protein
VKEFWPYGGQPYGWSARVKERAARDHARKKAARRQKRHLRSIKGPAALRQIVLAGRRRQRAA